VSYREGLGALRGGFRGVSLGGFRVCLILRIDLRESE